MRNESGIFPTGDIVLVLPLKVEEKSAGGIVLAQQVVDKEQLAQTYGIVVAWGDDAPREPRMKGVQVGKVVFFARYSGNQEKGDDGQWYRLIRADDILGWRHEAPSDGRRPTGRDPMAKMVDNAPKTLDAVTTPE